MSINQQVFTDAGKAMVGAANAGGTLTITKIVVGTGAAAVDADLYPLTALIAWKADVAIIRKTDLGGGKIIVSGPLVEANMTAGASFPLKELGVMAKIGTGPEQLYSVSNVYGDTPDTVVPGGSTTHAFDIIIQVDRATNVTITLDDPNTVDCQNIPTDATVGPGLYALRFGNIFQFKRLVAGSNIVLTEASDRITVAMKSVTTNTNLYVPANHPNAPSPDVAFATIQDALTYLNDYFIPSNKVVTIHIWKGTYPITPVVVSHANQSKIFITGEPRVDHTVVAINYLDPTHKNVQLSGDISDLVVGMRVYLANSIPGWSGGAKITAKAGAVVTLSTEKRDGQPNFTTSDPNAGRRLSYFPTVLTQSDPSKVTFASNDLASIANLTIDGGLHCLHLTGTTSVSNVHAYNGGTGIALGDGTLFGEIVVTQCDFGMTGDRITVQGAIVYINACTMGASAAQLYLGAQNGAQTNHIYFAHNATGVRGWTAKAVLGMLAASSNDFVVDIEFGGACLINPAPGLISTFDNNGTALYAFGMSYIQYSRNGQASPSSNPAAETIGNQNSLIHMA